MIIKTLAENTAVSEAFGSEHGLSLYIETAKHHLLFDMGASALFAENAAKMGVDLSTVDIAVLSHDHYDHGGGLKKFLELNQKAKIHVSAQAFGKRYAKSPDGKYKYIGIDESLLSHDRFVFVSGYMRINEEMELFSGVRPVKFAPSGNKDLFMMRGDSMVPDDFAHEQNLIIREGGKVVLIAGCAHNGIVNIIEHMQTAGYGSPTHVIGGFHLYNRSADRDEDPELVGRIGNRLNETDSQYYTCHCTGIGSYNILKTIMGDRIGYLASGSQILI